MAGDPSLQDFSPTVVVEKTAEKAPTRAADLVGKKLDRYLVVERVGAGGMGDVYRAYDAKLKREVALKILKPAATEDEALGDADLRLPRFSTSIGKRAEDSTRHTSGASCTATSSRATSCWASTAEHA